MIAILYPLKMDKNLSEAYSSIYKEGTKYGLTKGTGKPGGAMAEYLKKKKKEDDKKNEVKEEKSEAQKKYEAHAKDLEEKDKKKKKTGNPAFDDPSHHSFAKYKTRNEGRFRAEWEAFKLIEREDYIERFENWKNGLVEEGYDVSRWSKEDLVETFITENDLFSSQQSIIDALFEADKKGKGSGTKDACYHKVKSRYSVWPSAYASGALVKCRKKGAKNWGNSSKKEDFSDWRSDLQLNEILEKGTKGKVDFRTGKQTTDTGKKTKEGYPISQEKQVMKTKRVTVNNPKGRKRNESPMGKTISKLNQVKSKQWKAEDKGDTKTAQKMYDRRKKLSGVLFDKTGNFHDRADND